MCVDETAKRFSAVPESQQLCSEALCQEYRMPSAPIVHWDSDVGLAVDQGHQALLRYEWVVNRTNEPCLLRLTVLYAMDETSDGAILCEFARYCQEANRSLGFEFETAQAFLREQDDYLETACLQTETCKALPCLFFMDPEKCLVRSHALGLSGGQDECRASQILARALRSRVSRGS